MSENFKKLVYYISIVSAITAIMLGFDDLMKSIIEIYHDSFYGS